MRVTSGSWMILRDQVLDVDGRLHIASRGAQAGRVGPARSSATSRMLRARARKRLRRPPLRFETGEVRPAGLESRCRGSAPRMAQAWPRRS